MLTVLTNALQKCTPPDQLMIGMLAYFNKHTQRVGSLLDSIAAKLADDNYTDSLSAEYPIMIKSGKTEHSNSYWVTVGDLKNAINSFIANDAVAEDVTVTVHNSENETSTLSLSEVTDRIAESYSLTQGLVATMEGVVESVRSGASDALAVIHRHLDAINLKDTVLNGIKSGLSSISMTVNGLTGNNVLGVTSAILNMFGITSSKTVTGTATAATYDGIDAMTVILSDMFNTTVDAISRLPSVFLNLVGMIGGAFYAIGSFMANKLLFWVVDKVRVANGQHDAISEISGGDGSVNVSYSYFLPDSDGGDFSTSLIAAFTALNTTSLQILIPTGSLFVSRIGGGCNLCFIPKVINPCVLSQALYKHFGYAVFDVLPWYSRYDDDYLYHSSVADLGNKSFSCTPQKAAEFITDLFSSDELYTINQWQNFDPQYATGIMVSQWLTIVLCYLYSKAVSESWDDSLTMATIFNYATQSAPNAVLQQFTTGTSPFKVTNRVMATIACSMQNRSSAFGAGANANVITFVGLDSPNSLYAHLLNSLCAMCDDVIVPTSIENGTGCFVPYSTTIVHPKPSWYIPSDAENVANMQNFLKTGAIVVAVVVAIIVGAKILRNMRMKSFELAARSGSLSWKAAETGDASLMAQAFKANKKSMLLARLCGFATDCASSGNINIPGNGQVIRVGQLIKSNFS